MVDIHSNMCSCEKRKHATFGFPNDENATCCKNCKKEGMIDIKNIYNLCKCEIPKQASFGFPNDKKATCCLKCKKEGMVGIRGKKK
jgi:hypothetical protein